MADYTDGGLYLWKKADPKITTIEETAKSTQIINDALSKKTKQVEGVLINLQYPPVPLVACLADGTTDDAFALQALVNYVNTNGGGELFLPSATCKFGTTISVPEGVTIRGAGENTSKFKYTGTDFAFVTSNTHLRINFRSFSLDLNYTGSGIKIGQAQVDRVNGKIPRQCNVENVRVGELTTGKYGLRLENASHVFIKSCRLAYGNGGIGLSIWNDNSNAGVVTAVDSTIGRTGEMDIGLEIDSTYQAGLDAYAFIGCYFGGKTPIKLGQNVDVTSKVRNVTFTSIHIEPTAPTTGTTNAVEIYKADAVVFNGVSLAGFSNANINGFCFKGDSKSITIRGVDANEFKGTIYKNEAGNDLDNSEIQEASLSGSTSVGYTMFSGNFDYVTKLSGKRLKHRNMEATYFIGSTNNKFDWGTQSPTLDNPLQVWTRGDMRWNVNKSELGTTGSKYVLTGWSCTGSGTPGTWVEMRALTGQ